ncbi:MAG: serine hydrolase domain-containing protein [Planctomycetota bacterium]
MTTNSCGTISWLLLVLLLGNPSSLLADDKEKKIRWGEQAAKLAQPLIDSEVVPSLVIGLYDGGHTEVHAFGVVGPKQTKPNGKTVYEIGSITKVFTGLLLADAVQRKQVALDDPLSKFLRKGIRAPQHQKTEITLEHLATHRSALPRVPANLASTDLVDPYADYGEKLLLEFLHQHDLAAAPGSAYGYSNLGMGLLGYVLANVSKSDYPALVRKRIARPLAMKDTVVTLSPKQKRRRAIPHRDGIAVQPWEFDVLCGAGGIRSTVDDMLLFIAAHVDVAKSPLAKTIPVATSRKSENMGLGWHIAGDGITLFHNGQTGGYSSGLFVCPSFKKGVVVLANGASTHVDVLAERLIQMLFGMKVEPPEIRKRVKVPAAELQKLAGEYPSTLGFTIFVRVENGALFVQLTNQVAIRVYAKSPRRFFYQDIAAELEFEVEPGVKHAKAVTLFQNGREMRCERKQ